jgi:hypothetical protein
VINATSLFHDHSISEPGLECWVDQLNPPPEADTGGVPIHCKDA